MAAPGTHAIASSALTDVERENTLKKETSRE
jgi:hypothetical protein